MTVEHKFSGILTALPTPLAVDGRVDVAALSEHVKRLAEAGSHGIVPLGGTGEYTSLTMSQRLDVIHCAVEAADGRLPVIAGVLSPGLGDVLENAKTFMEAGADALMVVTPYYFRPTQEGIVDYFKRISDEIDADLVLYEIPYRTGVSLHYETVERLARETRVVAIKACNPDLAQQMRVAELTQSTIAILTGEEDVLPLHVAMGAVGAIISSSNLVPRQWARVLKLARQGELPASIALHATLRPLIDAMFAESNPAPLKAAMNSLGWSFGEVLPPLRPASEALRARLERVLPPFLAREAAEAHPSI